MNLYQIQITNLSQQLFKINQTKQNIFLGVDLVNNRIDFALKRGEWNEQIFILGDYKIFIQNRKTIGVATSYQDQEGN